MKNIILIPLVTVLALSGLNAADPDQNTAKPSEPQATPVKKTMPAEDSTTSPSAKTSDKQQTQTTNTKPVDGSIFAKKAAKIGMTEIETGKLAQARGGTSGIKEFGAMMVKDHTKIADQLKAVAAKENIELPTALEGKHQKLYDKLAALEGTAFDQEYIAAMVEGHQKAVALFKDAAANCSDPELKKFANNNLSALELHLKHAEALQKGL